MGRAARGRGEAAHGPPEPGGRARLERARRTLVPFAWLALVLVVSGALALAALALVGGASRGPSAWDPLLARAEARLEPPASERADELAERARRAFPAARVEVTRDAEGASLALVRRGAPAEALADLARFLRGEGIRATRFASGRELARLVGRIAEDPGRALGAARAALPAVLLAGGSVMLVAGALLARRLPPPPPPRATLPRRLLAGVGLGLACAAVVEALALLLAALGAPVREQAWLAPVLAERGATAALVAAYVVTIAPLGEELFFRGWLFRALEELWGAAAGALLSSLAFAAVHANPPAFPAYLAYGLALAWGARRSRSLAVPVAAHATVNLLALALAWRASA